VTISNRIIPGLWQRREEAERRRIAEEELRAYRATLVPRPHPAPHPRPFQVHPSDKALTEPDTPEFAKPKGGTRVQGET
jgi:hypothetical protein